jgi:hypothetical protein
MALYPDFLCNRPQGTVAARDPRRDLSASGQFRYAMMETPHVAKLRDEKAAFPDAANNCVKALRQLFAWVIAPEYGYAKRTRPAT